MQMMIYTAYTLNSQTTWALSGVTAKETYLDIDKMLAIAKKSQTTMIHPGYGFLSEREFAQAVIDAGLIWIGPSPER